MACIPRKPRKPLKTTHGHSQAARGWSCGDTALTDPKSYETSALPGRFKVGGPTKRAHRRGSYGSIEVS